MKNVLAALVIGFVGLAVMGCGSPNAQAICEKACVKVGNCQTPPWTSVEVATCEAQSDCAHINDNPQHCKNFDAQANCANDCLSRECSNLDACLNGCPPCQQ